MKKFFGKLMMYYEDWRAFCAQRKLESDLELILDDMTEAAKQLIMYRNYLSLHSRKKFMEAAMVIELGNDSIKKSLPRCSPKFQKEALTKIRVIEGQLQGRYN